MNIIINQNAQATRKIFASVLYLNYDKITDLKVML